MTMPAPAEAARVPGAPTPDAQLAIKAWSLFLDDMTARVSAELESRGIRCVLLKGAVLARLLYDRDYDRGYTDADLLVQSAHVAEAERALCGLGFVRTDRDEDWVGPAPKYAHTFQRPRDRAMVDLHWRLSGAAASPEAQWSALINRTRPLEIGGRAIDTLDEPASAVMVALHAAHHGASRPTALAELGRGLDRLELAVWAEARRLARELGAEEQFAAGLRLAPAGVRLADRLELADPRSVELWLKANPGSYGAWLLDRLTQTTSLRGRVAICLRVAVPTRRQMHTFAPPLAKRGRIGLGLAYALRPLRLMIHGVPAVREWVRARRAVRTG